MRRQFTSISSATIALLVLSACGGEPTTNSTSNANKQVNVTNVNAIPDTNLPATITATADGNLVKVERAGIQFTVPQSFKVKKEGDDIVVIPEKLTKIYFHVPDETNYAKAFTTATTELGKYMNDIKVLRTDSEFEFNKLMLSKNTRGEGVTKEGKPTVWNLTVYDAPRRALMSINISDPAAKESNNRELYKMILSFKKL